MARPAGGGAAGRGAGAALNSGASVQRTILLWRSPPSPIPAAVVALLDVAMGLVGAVIVGP